MKLNNKNLDIKGYLKAHGLGIVDLANILNISRPIVNNGLNFMELAPGEKRFIKQKIKEASKNGK